ncbi:dTDP-4-dehydrorhamnose 3,5-epimerase [Tateyamaria pelophila]|uniref:dTDP-4-dehydrorhamnose 3,5-epimerase n=1 Tax=Tateyamaria pelophila TaxID=328415 RepID=UPI001CC05922|nr:dTDP-4-dehydrorhamnose 3,5-epimerase [Tateyamaria pelophila]
MQIEDTPLAGLKILIPARFGDARGFFCESWNVQRMRDAGLDYTFVQDNHSLSAKRGTLRGLHYQSPPHAQAKLVRCGRGRLWDVAVDARAASPTYGQWFGLELSFENGKQLMIPAGFLHGFVTLTDDVEIVYKCTDIYAPDCDGAVHWDSCGINWPLTGAPILSDKDTAAQDFTALDTPFVWDAAT